MWTYEHSIDTSATPESVWRLWADVENWGRWDHGVEKVEIHGPFAAGTEITMTPAGQDPIRLRVAELTEHELFVDEARLDDLVIRTIHRLEKLDQDRTRVVYRMEISGPGAENIGPAITADFPETMAALVKLAQD